MDHDDSYFSLGRSSYSTWFLIRSSQPSRGTQRGQGGWYQLGYLDSVCTPPSVLQPTSASILGRNKSKCRRPVARALMSTWPTTHPSCWWCDPCTSVCTVRRRTCQVEITSTLNQLSGRQTHRACTLLLLNVRSSSCSVSPLLNWNSQSSLMFCSDRPMDMRSPKGVWADRSHEFSSELRGAEPTTT